MGKSTLHVSLIMAVLSLVAFAACEQVVAPLSELGSIDPQTIGEVLAESDDKTPPPAKREESGSDSGGMWRVVFLPPIAPEIASEGEFAGHVNPQVRVSEVNGPHIVTFDTVGHGSGTIRTGDEHFIVNFHLNQYSIDPATLLSIQVLLDGTVEAEVFAQVIATGRYRAGVSEQRIPLLRNQTLPIKFRVEQRDSGDSDHLPIPPPVSGIEPEPTPINIDDDLRAHEFALLLEEPAAVFYRSIEDLPDWIELDKDSGQISVRVERVALDPGEQISHEVRFYSSFNDDRDDDVAGGSTLQTPLVRVFQLFRKGDL